MFLDIKKYPRRPNVFPFKYNYPSDIEITHIKKVEHHISYDEMIDFVILNDYEDFYSIWIKSENLHHDMIKFCMQLNGQITLYDCKWFKNDCYNLIKRKHLIGFECDEDSMAFRLKWL